MRSILVFITRFCHDSFSLLLGVSAVYFELLFFLCVAPKMGYNFSFERFGPTCIVELTFSSFHASLQTLVHFQWFRNEPIFVEEKDHRKNEAQWKFYEMQGMLTHTSWWENRLRSIWFSWDNRERKWKNVIPSRLDRST